MEITHVIRRGRRAMAPPSVRAQIFLVLSAFLCGTVLASLLFVGVWRHTAADGARAHALQVQSHELVIAARRQIATLSARLDQERVLLAAAHTRERRAQRTLDAQRAALDSLDRSLPPRLQAVDASARGLSAKLSTLASELSSLDAYLRDPGPAGVDVGYLTTQAGYLASSAETASAAAGTVVRESRAAAAAAAAGTRN